MSGREIRRCSVPSCENRHKAHGYCEGHYERFKKYGASFDQGPVVPSHRRKRHEDKVPNRPARRSGSVEAVAGGVEGTALSAKLANSLAQSKKLEQTYVPVQVEMVRIADDARRAGRQKLRNKGG